MKLLKLMYIVERISLLEAESPIFGGRYCSLPRGPIISEVLDALNHDEWEGLHKSDSNQIHAKSGIKVPVEYLSQWANNVIERVYLEFGAWDANQVSEYTHTEFPEWKRPNDSDRGAPIKISDILPDAGPELESLADELSYLDSLAK